MKSINNTTEKPLNKTKNKKNSTIEMILIAFFSALIAICSQIQVPATIPFTLQTFAVFVAAGILGFKRGTISVLIYILLGLIGVPVFSGFSAGVASLFGLTGGYIIGFIFTAIFVGASLEFIDKRFYNQKDSKTEIIKSILYGTSMVIGLFLCYTFGTIWFMTMYLKINSVAISLGSALSLCVLPFIIFDILKIVAAVIVINRVKKYVNL